MNKLIKMFKVIIGLLSMIAIIMVVAFIVMFIELAQYKECSKNNFASAYCEKYKDF